LEVISPGWIEAMLELAQLDGVGAVGARLLHADRTIQHVGIVLGPYNGAAHIYHGMPDGTIGYNGITHLIRNYSCVTGACMATRRSLLDRVGGFNKVFAIDYNDVDYCLRLSEIGYRTVYTPFAELFHFENSTVLRKEASSVEAEEFHARWGARIRNDPFYNPNLPRHRHDLVHSIGP
jgi:O-antigen biosynthesis protein